LNMTSGPLYDQALKVLGAAHEACFNHPDRDVLGMSYGPFSGVNEALGIISQLETENRILRARLGEYEMYCTRQRMWNDMEAGTFSFGDIS
jgi:hypothetical protein